MLLEWTTEHTTYGEAQADNALHCTFSRYIDARYVHVKTDVVQHNVGNKQEKEI